MSDLWPTVAFEINEMFFGDADDVQAGAETVHVDPIMAHFNFVAFLPKGL